MRVSSSTRIERLSASRRYPTGAASAAAAALRTRRVAKAPQGRASDRDLPGRLPGARVPGAGGSLRCPVVAKQTRTDVRTLLRRPADEFEYIPGKMGLQRKMRNA